MAINEAQIREVHATVRAVFKGTTKSSNKIYLLNKLRDVKITSAMQKKAELRNQNAMARNLQRSSLRDSKAYVSDDFTAFGYEVLDKEDIGGNCFEMAAAAAYLIMRERLGTAWIVGISDPGDHTFCLVDNGVAAHPKSINGYRTCNADSWIIDPWANVCCRMREYDDLFSAKMQKWEKQGKHIIVARKYRSTVMVMNPAGYTYLKGFRTGKTLYYKASANVPQGVPRALLGVLSDLPTVHPASSKKSQCVIL